MNETQINANRMTYEGLVGKTVTVMVTGLLVKGTVKAFSEDTHAFHLTIEHEPVQWGNDTYTVSYPFARKCDNWGSLMHVKEVK